MATIAGHRNPSRVTSASTSPSTTACSPKIAPPYPLNHTLKGQVQGQVRDGASFASGWLRLARCDIHRHISRASNAQGSSTHLELPLPPPRALARSRTQVQDMLHGLLAALHVQTPAKGRAGATASPAALCVGGQDGAGITTPLIGQPLLASEAAGI